MKRTTRPPLAKVLRKEKKPLVQTLLDFGQRSLGKRTLCASCGLLYVNGDAEDEKEHAKLCKTVTSGIPFQGWKMER